MGSGSTPEGNLAKAHHPPPDDLESSQAKRQRPETDEARDTANNKTRIRVTRACDECRRRKDRCDGQRPSCQSCLVAKRTCAYNPSKKRGLRTGYVRSLEVLLGFLLGTVDGLDAWISTLLEGEARPPKLQLKTATDRVEDVTEFAMSTWRKSEVLKKLEKVPSLSEAQEEDDESSDSFEGRLAQALAGLTQSQEDRDVSRAKAFPQVPMSPIETDGTSSILFPANPSFSSIISPQNTHAMNPEPSITCFEDSDVTLQAIPKDGPKTDQLKVPPNWSYLLDLHFAKTHSWFPISQKHDLLRPAYTLANNSQAINMTSLSQRGDAAFFWASLAYASQQSDSIDASLGRASQDRNLTPTLYDTARRLVFVESQSGEFEIGHVRAFLLLALFETSRGSWQTAWVTIGQAVYMASCLKLLGGASQVQGPIDEGVKRTLLGCIALETLLAYRLNARPYFLQSDIQRIGPLQTEGIEEWEPWQPRMDGDHRIANHGVAYRHAPGHVLSTFSTFINTMEILNSIVMEKLSGQSKPRTQAMDRSLQLWKLTLPQTVGDLSGVGVSPQVLNLQMAVNCVENAINTQKSIDDNLSSISPATERWTRVRQLSDGLKQRIQAPEGLWMPPLTPVYLFILRESFPMAEGSLQNPSIEDTERLCQDSLSDAERTWWNHHTPSTPTYSSSQENALRGESNRQPAWTPQNPCRSMSIKITSQTPISSEQRFPNQNSSSQSTLVPGMNNTTFGTLENEIVPPSEHQRIESEVSNLAPEFSSVPKQAQGLQLDALPESLMGRMEEEELFDSLAILDPTDWVANPPEFMRHLGDLREAPTDIHSFFDPDPT